VSDKARRATRDRRGIAASEFALVAGLFFLTVIAILELSRYFMTLESSRNVVAQAARAMMINPSLAPSDGTATCNSQALLNATGGLSFVSSTGTLCTTRSSPCLSDPAGSNGRPPGRTQIVVTLTAPYEFLIPVFGVTNLTISETQTFCFAT
jgi:Flp pilus assembly protein TadG